MGPPKPSHAPCAQAPSSACGKRAWHLYSASNLLTQWMGCPPQSPAQAGRREVHCTMPTKQRNFFQEPGRPVSRQPASTLALQEPPPSLSQPATPTASVGVHSLGTGLTPYRKLKTGFSEVGDGVWSSLTKSESYDWQSNPGMLCWLRADTHNPETP